MKRILFGLTCACVLAATSAEESPSQLALTIYNDDLALVQDVRRMAVGAGRTKLEFKDVSAQIRPETVTLAGAGLEVLEQNFDFDLLTPAKMMEKAVGREVQIVRTNPGNGQETTETATVLSTNNGVVVKIGDRIEVLRQDGAPTRVIFDRVPDNLRARPTLSIDVLSETASTREVTLRHLTKGLSWKADYVALFDEKAGSLDMQGWVTLTNNSGTTFSNAQAQLVAGKVKFGEDDDDDEYERQRRAARQRAASLRQAGAEGSDRPAIADLYVYPLSEPTTIANQQTKQVGFLDVKGVQARKVYEHAASWFETISDPVHASVVVRFANSAPGGLGSELPAGMVRVYVRDADGLPKFVGENRIDHTPQGSEVSVKTGEAFDVTVSQTLTKREKVSLFRSRYSMEYVVSNARGTDVSVELRQGGLWRSASLGRVHREHATRCPYSSMGRASEGE